MGDSGYRRGSRYRSYLLRLWQTADGDRQVLRVSLEQPGSGRRLGFAGLDELVAFLKGAIAGAEDEGLGGETDGERAPE